MSLNRVALIGRLTRDPELKYTTAGIPVAQMGIAVHRVTKNESGDYDVDFFNIVAWRRTAEFAHNYLKKGRLVSVDGRLQTRSWVDQATGQKRSVVEIVADGLEGLDRREEGEGGGSEIGGSDSFADETPAATPVPARSAPAATTSTRRAAPAPPADDDLDESDPFADD